MGFDSSLLLSFIGLGVQQQAPPAETEMSSGLPACQPAWSGELLSLGKFFITEKTNSTGSSQGNAQLPNTQQTQQPGSKEKAQFLIQRFPAPAPRFSLENELLAKPIQSHKAFQF